MKRNLLVCFPSLLVLLGVVGVPALIVYPGWHKEALGRDLITAIKHQDTKSVLAALNAGADPNARDHSVDRRASIEHLQDAVFHRNQPAFAPERFETALDLLFDEAITRQANLPNAERFVETVCHALLEHGANPNTPPNSDINTLGKASQTGDVRCVRDLLDHGAKANGVGVRGWSAIMAAFDNPEMLAFLLAKGADPYRRDKIGDNVFDINNALLILTADKTTLEYKNILRVHAILEHYRRAHPAKHKSSK